MGAVSTPLGPHSIDAMLDDLRTLVEIESPSLDLDALQTSAEALAAMIEQQTVAGGLRQPVGEPPRLRQRG